MNLEAAMNAMPFAELLGMELTAAADGRAEGRLELRDAHLSVPGGEIAHGGVTYALADTVGGAAVMSLQEAPTPTVDMRIDYLTPARRDLRATAEVIKHGQGVAVADVIVTDVTDATVATARGVYKTGGLDGDSAWSGPVSRGSTRE